MLSANSVARRSRARGRQETNNGRPRFRIHRIGGNLPASERDRLVDLVNDEALSVAYDGPAFDAGQFVKGEPLVLYADQVAWGRLDDLESFCIAYGLPFARWSGRCSGSFGPARAVFTGSGDVRFFAADEEEEAVISRRIAKELGRYAAIIAHFDAADFVVPPLRLIG